MSTSEAALGGPVPQRLVYEFEELDLSPYEARIVVALMRLGAANTLQLAHESGVPRTSIYTILNDLQRKGLAQPLSVDGPAMWASPGRDAVFDRLDAAQDEKLRMHRERTARMREMAAEAFPETQSALGPYVHVVQGATHVAQIYDKLVEGAESELLVFNRPPYSYDRASINPTVIEALKRGVGSRVLYQADQWFDPEASEFREGMTQYHQAGVRPRLVHSIPLKLAVADRKVALLAMSDPVLPEVGFPVTLFVEHPGYASLQADAFELAWQNAMELDSDEARAKQSAARRAASRAGARLRARRPAVDADPPRRVAATEGPITSAASPTATRSS